MAHRGMVSESARNFTTAEARFRVQSPNSMPRRILVVALDPKTAALGRHLADEHWLGVRFANFDTSGVQQNRAFTDFAAVEETASDVVIVVGTAGSHLGLAARVAERYARFGREIAAMLIAPGTTTAVALDASLQALRPFARTLSIVRDFEFLQEVLEAFATRQSR